MIIRCAMLHAARELRRSAPGSTIWASHRDLIDLDQEPFVSVPQCLRDKSLKFRAYASSLRSCNRHVILATSGIVSGNQRKRPDCADLQLNRSPSISWARGGRRADCTCRVEVKEPRSASHEPGLEHERWSGGGRGEGNDRGVVRTGGDSPSGWTHQQPGVDNASTGNYRHASPRQRQRE
jgi:hypothetical protein